MGKIIELPDNEAPPSYSQTNPSESNNLQVAKYAAPQHQLSTLETDDERYDSSSSSIHTVTDTKPTHTAAAEYARNKSATQPSASSEVHKHHHLGQKLKNKFTGTTHEEREEARAKQAALYRRAYEATPQGTYGGGFGGYGYGYGGYGYGGLGGLGYGALGLGAGALLFDPFLFGGGLWF